MTPPRRRTASLACFPFAWNLPHRCQTRWPAFSIRSSIFYGKDRRTTSNSSTNSLARFLTLSNPLNLDRWFVPNPRAGRRRRAARISFLHCSPRGQRVLPGDWPPRQHPLAERRATDGQDISPQPRTRTGPRLRFSCRGDRFPETQYRPSRFAARAVYRTGLDIALQLDLDVFPPDVWREHLGPNDNFERYLRREVLAKSPAPLVWAMDEVDRLFTCAFASEVFGLFRSWHNARALEPSGPWRNLIFTCRKPAMMSAAITSCGPASIPKSAQCSVAIQAFIE